MKQTADAKRQASEERFRRAGVPRSCWALSCTERGQQNILDWAKDQKTRAQDRSALLSAYVQMPTVKVQGGRADEYTYCQETIELLARHAVLEGLPVKVVLFHQLLHNLAHPEIYSPQDADPEARRRTTVFDLLGHGVIVVPHLPAFASDHVGPLQYREAIDFLLTHIYEGGALVVGGTESISKRLASGYPPSLERMLLVNSEFFGTNT